MAISFEIVFVDIVLSFHESTNSLQPSLWELRSSFASIEVLAYRAFIVLIGAVFVAAFLFTVKKMALSRIFIKTNGGLFSAGIPEISLFVLFLMMHAQFIFGLKHLH